MKNIIVTLSLVFTQLSVQADNVGAFDRHLQKRNFGMVVYNVEENRSNSPSSLYSEGTVNVNLKAKKISLKIGRHMPRCPDSMPMCIQPMVMPLPLLIELPLVEVKNVGCNVIEYRAMTDATPVDGPKKEIIIRDNSQSPCEIVYPANFEVTYTYSTLRGTPYIINALADQVVQGGVSSYYYKTLMECSSEPIINDGGIQTSLTELEVESLNGNKTTVGYKAFVSENTFAGPINFTEYLVRKVVQESSELGKKTFFISGDYSLSLDQETPVEQDGVKMLDATLSARLKDGSQVNQEKMKCILNEASF